MARCDRALPGRRDGREPLCGWLSPPLVVRVLFAGVRVRIVPLSGTIRTLTTLAIPRAIQKGPSVRSVGRTFGQFVDVFPRVGHRLGMRAGRRVVLVVLGGQVALFLLLALVVDAVLVPGLAISLVALALLFVFLIRWQRGDARHEALLASGARVAARLVASRATATRIRNRTVQAHTFEAHAAGRVLRVEARAFTHLPVGTSATIAYDPADPGNATVVEDLDRS